jgi:hypothetical protein
MSIFKSNLYALYNLYMSYLLHTVIHNIDIIPPRNEGLISSGNFGFLK